MDVEKAYEELKNLLLKNRCRIIAEEKPKRIAVEQGSLWRASPKEVKKEISFYLIPNDSKTRIVSTSSLTPDWIGVSILGYVLAIILALIFWLLAMDLEAYITRGAGVLWSWLLTAYGHSGSPPPLLMVSFFEVLSAVGVIVLVYLIIADIYISIRKDSFAERVLRQLP